MTPNDCLYMSPLFEGLTEEECRKVLALGEGRTFEDDEIMIEEGAPGDALFVIKQGFARVEKRTIEGYEEMLSSLKDFECFGEMSLIDRGPRSASVRAMGKVTAMVFPQDELDELFDTHPRIRRIFLTNLAGIIVSRLRQVNENFIQSIYDSIIVVDKDYNILRWSRSNERDYFIDAKTAIHRNIFVLLPDLLEEGLDKELKRVMETGNVWREETSYRTKDGETVYMESFIAPYREAGEITGAVIVNRNTTELKKLEEQLIQSERLAAVGQLAAGIAHDFNNILMGIIGYAELLETEEGMPDVATTGLKRIREAGKRAAHLVRQILDFSRKSIIHREPLDLMAFLEEATRFLQRTIPENIRIVLEMGPDEYHVYADRTQMQQIVTNLAVNARDAMAEGGQLRFRLARFTLRPTDQSPIAEMPPGEWVMLSISDTGTGIRPEYLTHIFEPFFTTKGVGEGTGLGLAQVYGIVTQHKGFIDVESELGVGTKFVIYLAALSVRKKVAEQETSGELPLGHGETVLVVEDELAVLAMIGIMLKRLKYNVLTANTAEEALETYDRHRDKIALVLTDLVMPGMSGMELFRTLKERNPEVKVAVMTGYPLGDEREELLSRGISAWMRKPVDLGKLAQVMDQTLRSEPGQEQEIEV